MRQNNRLERVRFVLPLIVVGLICFFLAVLGYWLWSSRSDGMSVDETPSSRLSTEANAEIQFPASATNIYVQDRTFVDADIWVRFRMAPPDLSGFLSSTLCTQDLALIDPSLIPKEHSEPAWWELNRASKLKTCHGSHDDFGHQIWIDMSSSDMYIVYVMAGSY